MPSSIKCSQEISPQSVKASLANMEKMSKKRRAEQALSRSNSMDPNGTAGSRSNSLDLLSTVRDAADTGLQTTTTGKGNFPAPPKDEDHTELIGDGNGDIASISQRYDAVLAEARKWKVDLMGHQDKLNNLSVQNAILLDSLTMVGAEF